MDVEPRTAHELVGLASWYCNSDTSRGRWSPCHYGHLDHAAQVDGFAAAGPKLRAALCGDESCSSWRGRIVYVDGQRVQLVDWCQCFYKRSNEKLIDLYRDVFDLTGGEVTIRW